MGSLSSATSQERRAVFSAIGRYIRAFGYLITGRIDSARRALSRNPHVVRASFDRIIQEKKKQIGQYKDAVAGMIAQQERKISTVKQLTDDVSRLESLREGAAGKARSVVEEMRAKGSSMEEIKGHEEYIRCLSAFNDFSSSIEEKSVHATELERDIGELDGTVKNHKIQLQELLRDIDKLKEEQSATVADLITAKEEESVATIIAGISEDRFSKELEDMRQLRQEAKAKARISREMAGTDTKAQEAEFLEYARKDTASDEFDRLIGLAEEAESEGAAGGDEGGGERETRLPEE